MAATVYKNKKNNASGRLAVQLLAGGSSLTLKSGEGTKYPSTNFRMTLYKSDPDVLRENVLCATRTGDVCSGLTRAQEGTSDLQWEVDDNVKHMATTADWEAVEAAINTIATTGAMDALAVVGNGTIGGTLGVLGGAVTIGVDGSQAGTLTITRGSGGAAQGILSIQGSSSGAFGGQITLDGPSSDANWVIQNISGDLNYAVSDGSDKTVFILNSGAGDANLDVDGSINVGGTLDVAGVIKIAGIGIAQLKAEGSTLADLYLKDTGAGVDDKIMLLRNQGGNTIFSSLDDGDGFLKQNMLTLDHDTGNIGIGFDLDIGNDLTVDNDALISGALDLIGTFTMGVAGDFVWTETGNTLTLSAAAANVFIIDHAALSFQFSSLDLGFFGVTPISKPTITGSRGGNAAVASMATALANLGLWTDSTTA